MKFPKHPSYQLSSLAITIFLLTLALTFAGCSLLPVSEGESLKQTQIRETQIDINVRQTLLAQQQNEQHTQRTIQAQQATMTAQVAALNPGSGQATRASLTTHTRPPKPGAAHTCPTSHSSRWNNLLNRRPPRALCSAQNNWQNA